MKTNGYFDQPSNHFTKLKVKHDLLFSYTIQNDYLVIQTRKFQGMSSMRIEMHRDQTPSKGQSSFHVNRQGREDMLSYV